MFWRCDTLATQSVVGGGSDSAVIYVERLVALVISLVMFVSSGFEERAKAGQWKEGGRYAVGSFCLAILGMHFQFRTVMPASIVFV